MNCDVYQIHLEYLCYSGFYKALHLFLEGLSLAIYFSLKCVVMKAKVFLFSHISGLSDGI